MGARAMRTVGIRGGMGPEATVLLMQRLLQAVDARDDPDHFPLIVHQNPAVPSRIRRLVEGTGEDPSPVLAQMVRDLAGAGAEALAMPCNTAHAYAPQIMAATPLPFLDMRAATVAALPKGRVAMLASPALRITGAFDAHFASAGITPAWPKDDGPVLALIRRVKAGDTGAEAHREMAALAKAAEGHVIVACSALSLLTGALKGRFTDSLDCVVTAIRDFAKS
jgi:aspartate racemase